MMRALRLMALASALAWGGCSCGPEVRTYERDGLFIHHIALGIVNTYVIDVLDGGTLLIEAGGPDETDQMLAGLSAAGIEPKEIDAVIITHGHGDHGGGGKALRKELDAPFVVGLGDEDEVEAGDYPLEPGVEQTGEAGFLRAILDTSFPGWKPDIVLGAEHRMDDIGIPGTVIPMPGHTEGTLVVQLDTGDAFVGDIVRGDHEGDRGENEGECVTHFFSEDFDNDRAHMDELLSRGVKTFFPGHGPFFDRHTVRGWLEDTE